MSDFTLHLGDCLEVLPTLADNSIDAVVTDPPYYKVKDEAWDRQWATPGAFLAWMDDVLAECYRLLKPNGSLYVFASPKLAARVEVLIGERFNVLNHVVWYKGRTLDHHSASNAHRNEKDALRSFNPETERIIFAEHYGAEGYAKGEAGYGAKCDELRGFVFEPLRAYLASERDRAGLTTQDVAEAWRVYTGNTNRTGMAGHWFDRVQWALPTAANYQWLRDTFSRLNHGGEYLRQEYEDLRQEYEDLRRPFNVTPDVPYTDVWTFPSVRVGPGKHPTEKPIAMMRHILKASTRPAAVVLDPFMGGGSTGIAARELGRAFIGIEKHPTYFERAEQRIRHFQPLLLEHIP